ncbi:nucleoside diphosphate-linked moiety X motif mitochondrial [Brachionus plicatilis]|uniref:Nucleoside diphosphate-linked moiety X motif mitochondrial n=1 Tax=Brachionus plicatilis TaxID=10195 RepID=A0A3M7PAN1_BRAPC|nr:nucleoside diphosphate-linked moiety X motif mitochondrial [Brachionus plicatilis]
MFQLGEDLGQLIRMFYTPEEALEKNTLNKIKFIPPQLYEFNRIKRFGDVKKFAEYSLQRQKYGLTPWLPMFVNNRQIGLLPGDYMYEVVSELNRTEIDVEPTNMAHRLNRIIRNESDPTKPMYKIVSNYDFDVKIFVKELSHLFALKLDIGLNNLAGIE